MNYFKQYEQYYNALKDSKEIVSSSNNLSNICLETLTKANLNISSISNSKWNELSKNIFTNEILSNISNYLNEQISKCL